MSYQGGRGGGGRGGGRGGGAGQQPPQQQQQRGGGGSSLQAAAAGYQHPSQQQPGGGGQSSLQAAAAGAGAGGYVPGQPYRPVATGAPVGQQPGYVPGQQMYAPPPGAGQMYRGPGGQPMAGPYGGQPQYGYMQPGMQPGMQGRPGMGYPPGAPVPGMRPMQPGVPVPGMRPMQPGLPPGAAAAAAGYSAQQGLAQGQVSYQAGGPPVGAGGGGAGGPPVVVKPREKKVLTITDKDGNPIELGGAKKPKSTAAAPVSAPLPSTSVPPAEAKGATADAKATADAAGGAGGKSEAELAGAKLREAIERSIAEGGAAAVRKHDEEEKARKAAEEKAEAERKEAEEKARKEAEEKARKEAEEKARKEAEEKARKEAEERARKEAEERARKEAEERARKEIEERARAEAAERKAAEERRQAERKAAMEARAKSTGGGSLSSLANMLEAKEKEEAAKAPVPTEPKAEVAAVASPAGAAPGAGGAASTPLRPGGGLRPGASPGGFRPGGGLRPGGLRPGMSPTAGATPVRPAAGGDEGRVAKKRRVWNKEELLRFRDLDVCCCRPSDLPDMTIQRGQAGGGGGGGRGGRGGGGGNQWSRGAAQPGRGGGGDGRDRRGSSQKQGGGEWTRGQAPPRPPPNRGGRGGGGRRGNEPDPNFLDDGTPVQALTRNENRWVPVKSNSAMVVTEKTVKGILNKMTKEKFGKLSTQMCEIPILSYEMLTMMIRRVYEKAIFEPTFGDMYAELCVRLSLTAKKAQFVKIIESDEVDGEDGANEGNVVYRWSNDVDTEDDEIIGPFDAPEGCVDAALDADNCPDPIKRGDLELELHSLKIRRGIFIKILKPKGGPEGEKYYTVFFPVSKAEEIGQQMSDYFLSEQECITDGTKQNSFKRSLLNKCEDEFNKQDLFVDWKKEKAEYDAAKPTLSEKEQKEKEEDLEFRRIKIKKQMLGNIKFIGELYKKEMLKEKIMRYCINSLMKLEEDKSTGLLVDAKDDEMDEEDHEALCNLFTTIGKTIDHPGARSYMNIYFRKIAALSNDQKLNSRSRFMYKDLIDQRHNKWKLRREKETAKTLDEIKKEFEREERMQAQQSAQGGYRGGGGGRGGGGRGGGDYRGGRGGGDYRGGDYRGGDSRRDSRRDGGGHYGGGGDSRRDSRRQSKPATQTDEHGFTVVGRGGPSSDRASQFAPTSIAKRPTAAPVAPPPPKSAGAGPSSSAAPLSKEKLELKVKNMKAEFMEDPSNTSDLLLTMDELAGTPNSGETVVQINTDKAMDCKDAEREAIIEMLSILAQKGKLTRSDFEGPMGELVEFIDSFVIDSPNAFKYLGAMLAEFIHVKVLDVPWLCRQCAKLREVDAGTTAPERVIGNTLDSLKEAYSVDEAKSHFGASSESALETLLGADKWKQISSEKLG